MKSTESNEEIFAIGVKIFNEYEKTLISECPENVQNKKKTKPNQKTRTNFHNDSTSIP